ncbi:16581_t:CDS:2 [Racocetra fulgida]|uniref:16581_t:CDS:1 n=1 Tax=Racocetra fulgida TaxID=60492 RepID=A0A9N9F6H9_9GLOM|nr:16581_t:CDS:2 [Racocetra fulgida]
MQLNIIICNIHKWTEDFKIFIENFYFATFDLANDVILCHFIISRLITGSAKGNT